MIQQLLDQVILVDENDQQIGVMDKTAAHLDRGRLHRAVSVFLFNHKGELLIQKRSKYKIVAAQLWANTTCGNLRPNESAAECARRRLTEELGIKQMIELTELGKLRYQVSFENGYGENEIDTILSGFFSGQVFPNKEEVATVAWATLPQLREKKSDRSLAPWLSLIIEHPELGTKLAELSTKIVSGVA